MFSTFKADRIRRKSNDPFFLRGDLLSFDGSTSNIVYFQENEVASTSDENDVGPYNDIPWKHKIDDDETIKYPCAVANCTKFFTSLAECEKHYINSHFFECIECGRVFPSDHLLDLHLQETHDSFFAVSVKSQPQKQHFQCLVPECPVMFSSDADRTIHLRTDHSYPKWFRFHLKGNGNSQLNKKKNKRKKNRNKNNTRNSQNNENIHFVMKENNNGNENSSFDKKKIDEQKQIQKKRDRKQRKKEKNANIPCKFFHQLNGVRGGCSRGESCMFSHSNSLISTCIQINKCNTSTETNQFEEKNIKINEKVSSNKYELDGTNSAIVNDMDMDMDMDIDHALTNMFEHKMKVSIPKKISFGGKRRELRK